MTKIQPQSPLAVANFVIEIAKENSMDITNLQLQKVLFFLQGYCLSEYDSPLIDGSFSKWKYGPVMEEVYREFKDYGASLITDKYERPYFENGNIKIEEFDINRDLFDKSILETISKISKKLIGQDPWKMVNITHNHCSWADYKESIDLYDAKDYTDKEIRECFKDSEKQLGF